MATYKTKAIILSSYPYREHDRIVSFFSEDYGRLEARARGTRKIESKLAGHLEPFIQTELLLARGRHWDILAGSRTLSAMPKIRANIELTAAAYLCVEAVKLITKPGSAERAIFRALAAALLFLESDAAALPEKRAAVIRFLWQLLSFSGFSPELARCINCRLEVVSGAFSFEGGGALCSACAHHDCQAAPLSPAMLYELRRGPTTEANELTAVVIGFWRRVVDYSELKSWIFWQIINAEPFYHETR